MLHLSNIGFMGPSLGDFILGIEGLAILRAWANDDKAIMARVEEIARILPRLGDEPLSADLSMTESSVESGYSTIAETYDNTERNPVIAAEEPVVQSLLAEVPPRRALDAACGTGRHASFLASRGHEVVGIDQTEAMLERARVRVPEGSFRQGNLEALDFENGSFDLVVCALALTHVPDPTEAIAELGRVVRPGGRVVISDVHPFFSRLGFHAYYFSLEEDRRGFVRNHAHPISSYLLAFQAAGLTVQKCLEPVWDERVIATQRWSEGFGEAADQALLGLPLILVWDLVKVDQREP